MRTDDDRLATELRAVLDEVDQALAQRPPTSAPWAGIQQFLKASRARRRRRITLAVAAAAMAVVSVLVLQNRLFPASDQGRAPVPSGPPFARWDQPRGSLAGNQKWLREFREYARTHWAENDGVSHPPQKPEPGKNVKVLYASDVGDYRVGVAIGEWPEAKGRVVAEFFGPRGASVDQLLAGRSGPAPERTEGTDTYWNVLTYGLSPRGVPVARTADLRPSVYLLTDGAPEALVQEPPTIDADGKVTQHTRRVEFHDGFAELTFDRPGHYAVFMPNPEPGYETGLDSNDYRDFVSGPQEFGTRAESVNLIPSRGGETAEESLRNVAQVTWMAARQSYTVGNWQLLTGEPGSLLEAGPARAVVGVLTLPSGARVLSAGHTAREPLKINGKPGSEIAAYLDTAELLPAGDNADAAMAWRISQSGQHPARTAAMGPAGTATVQWTTSAGGVATSPAVNTLAVVERKDVVEARFLGAVGQELGTAKVLDPVAARFDAGDALDKSPDQVSESWILPEVKDGLAGF